MCVCVREKGGDGLGWDGNKNRSRVLSTELLRLRCEDCERRSLVDAGRDTVGTACDCSAEWRRRSAVAKSGMQASRRVESTRLQPELACAFSLQFAKEAGGRFHLTLGPPRYAPPLLALSNRRSTRWSVLPAPLLVLVLLVLRQVATLLLLVRGAGKALGRRWESG